MIDFRLEGVIHTCHGCVHCHSIVGELEMFSERFVYQDVISPNVWKIICLVGHAVAKFSGALQWLWTTPRPQPPQ